VQKRCTVCELVSLNEVSLLKAVNLFLLLQNAMIHRSVTQPVSVNWHVCAAFVSLGGLIASACVYGFSMQWLHVSAHAFVAYQCLLVWCALPLWHRSHRKP